MTSESYELSTGDVLHILLMTDVKNIDELRKKLICQQIHCGFIKPSLIIDPFQIVVAANKAILSLKRNKLITKNVYTEILYNLSISTHITHSLQKFGIDARDNAFLMVYIGEKDGLNEIMKQIDGVKSELSNLEKFTNIDSVKECYDIKEIELSVSPLIDSVVSRIACKSVL